jgi:histidine triad (HIT) family protein
MKNCIFCDIVTGDEPGDILYQDDTVTAFRDIHPVAPTHVLIIPNRHISTVNELTEADEPLIGHMFTTARKVALMEGIAESGYRLILNTNYDGGQVIYHMHLHLIGGRRMRYPMG